MKTVKLFCLLIVMIFLPSLSYSDDEAKQNNDCDKSHLSGKHFDGDHFLEKITEKLDLQTEQVSSIKGVIKQYKTEREERRHHNMHGFLKLDPDNENYMEEVEKFAKEKAALVEAKIIRRAQMRVAIHGVLTAEQKEKITNLHGMMRMGTPHR